MEFKDMADVAYVDEAVLDRTYRWLLSKQDSDGTFTSAGGHGGGITSYGSTRIKATAFTAWALRHAGFDNTKSYERAMDALVENREDIDNNYVRALVLNAIGDKTKVKARDAAPAAG